jgi:hypothetical protein
LVKGEAIGIIGNNVQPTAIPKGVECWVLTNSNSNSNSISENEKMPDDTDTDRDYVQITVQPDPNENLESPVGAISTAGILYCCSLI